MKKALKWIGIGLLALLAVAAVWAFLGKEETLALKIGAVDLSAVPDGVYAGQYDGYRFSNSVTVSVSEHRITAVESVKGQDGREDVRRELTDRILAAQSPAVDAVTGATADSNAFLKAVEDALLSAQ